MAKKSAASIAIEDPSDLLALGYDEPRDVYMTMLERDVVIKAFSSKDDALETIKTVYARDYCAPLTVANGNTVNAQCTLFVGMEEAIGPTAIVLW